MKRLEYGNNEINIIQGEIARLETMGLIKRQGSRVFVRCPFHPDKNPSAILNTDVNSRYPFGNFKCFACDTHGNWNKLAEALGAKQVHSNFSEGATVIVNSKQAYKERVIDGKKKSNSILDELNICNPRSVTEDWRSIPKKLLRAVKAKICTHNEYDTEYLYLPCIVNRKVVGAIRAAISERSNIKYKNSIGNWSKVSALYPYDFTKHQIDKLEELIGIRAVVLVEGARDSLAFNSKGIPTLGILGTTSWTEEKRDLVLDLELDYVLVCMDGDKPGRKAECKIVDSFDDYVRCTGMNLSRFNRVTGYAVDPANCPDWVIKKVKQFIKTKKVID